jgi:hypothetical protein
MRKLLVVLAIVLAIAGCTSPGSTGAPAGSAAPGPSGAGPYGY